MSSLSGVSSSNTVSSLMNSANMISGLASGLDTEGMIESLVKSYQTKISQLNQKATKVEWKQDAYRSIISKMVGFSNKYASYTSNTNLMSPSFFNSAVKAIAKGEFADSVSASGKTGSDISLDAVHQLAKSAQYRTKSDLASGDLGTIAGAAVDLSPDAAKDIELSNLSGSLTLTYGSKTVDISFSESSTAKDMADIRTKLGQGASDAEVLAEYINQKLADEKIVFNSGSAESADKRIKAVANGGSITFQEQGTARNGLYISGASGNIASQLGLSEEDLEDAKEKKITKVETSGIMSQSGQRGLTRSLNAIEYLSEKSQAASASGMKLGMNMSLDGATKAVAMPDVKIEKNYDGTKYYLNGAEVSKDDFAQKYTDALSAEVKKAFGDKVTVENKGTDGKLQLEFKVKNEGSELVVNTGVGEALGIGSTATSYLNTSKTLGDLLGDKFGQGWTQAYERDSKGNIKRDEGGNKILAKDSKGDPMYDFTINGKVVGSFSKNSSLSEVMTAINSDKEAGVQVSYSQATQNFTFTSKETGADSKIEMGEGLAQAMFGKPEDSASGSYTKGQDAIFTATINGEQKYMTRTSNSVKIDGLTINMTETFNSKVDANGEPVKGADGKFEVDNAKKSVTFQSKTDSDKVIDTIKTMVADYNTMMSEIKSAYSTMPYQKSSGSFANYEPLTDEDREGMSESAIERYEEKAKQGILFGDRELSSLYTKMNQAFAFSNREDVDALKDMGISIGYSITDGTQTVQVDEDKLRAMLDSDPDRVADLFTKNDGIMDRMKTQLDNYSRTTGEPKGILIQKAGSPLSSLSLMNNTWQKEIDNYSSQIEKWQEKLEAQVEKYTSQFSRLEQLIQQMNSQSSTLAGMMGG